MKKKRFLLLLLALSVAVFSAMAVGCKNKNPQGSNSSEPVEYFDYDNYYFDGSNGEENTLSFGDGANFTLNLNGESFSGVLAYENGAVTLPVGNQTATLTYANEVITFVLGGNTYYFNKDIDYTVAFETNGGSSVASVSVKNGRTLAKPADPTKDGYVFIGWYKSADLTGNKFTFNGEKIKGEVTLYARWIEKIDPEYTVSFDLGYEAENPESLTTSGHKLFNLADPVRNGYEFKGWWISCTDKADKLSYKYDEETTEFDSDTTLFALWAANETESFTASISERRIEWEGAKGSVYVTVTSPDGNKLVDDQFQSSEANGGKDFAFTEKAAGEYVIEVRCSLGTVTRYYTNKALARARGFRVEDGTLTFAEVKNAQKYYITVECGEPSHSHADVEITTPSYDFSSCKMKVGGIKFTVRAVAENYADSVAYFTYDKTLSDVGGLTYDETAALLKWNAVEGATNYCLTINGTEYDTGSATSFDMRGFTGELTVSVVAEADGYNSSEQATYSFTKTAPVTPKNITLTGKTLSWDGVENATYKLEVADKNGGKQPLTSDKASIENFDKQLSFNLEAGSKFTVRVMATVNGVDSLWSDELTFNCLVLDKAPEYKNGSLYWEPVFGADGYEVCVNGDESNLITLKDSATSVKVNLANEGQNTFKMRFSYGENKSEWTNETSVTAYGVEFVSNGGTDVSRMLIAENDSVTLPGTMKRGYNFVGWYDAKENGKKYDKKTFTDNCELVLYAYWEAKKYEVTFDYGEYGKSDETSREVTYDSVFNLPVPNVDSKTAMAFIGWFDTPSEGGLQYAEGNGEGKFEWKYTNGVKLYARYAQAFEYKDDGSGAYIVKASSSFNPLITDLYIPATYNGKPVREIAEYGFKNCRALKTVSIPDTLEVIASTAFIDCDNISSYVVREATPGSPVYQPKFTVGENGELLEHYYITGDVELAFIPSTITQSEGVYTVPSVVTRMGEYLFKGAKFTKVIIPTSVVEVSAYAFQSCRYLETIEFLKTEKRADDETPVEIKPLTVSKDFVVKCSNITEIIFPERLQEIEGVEELLCQFTRLKSVQVLGSWDKQVYTSVDGMLCNNTAAGPDTIIYCPRSKEFENVGTAGAPYYVWNVPSYITKIAANAFNIVNNADANYEYKLDKIVFPSLMVEIGDHAFYSTDRLKEVVFSGDGTGKHSGLTINAYAFASCPNLSTLKFEETGSMNVEGATFTYAATSTCGVSTIGNYAFKDCAITELLLPSTLESIGEYAFDSNSSLANIDFSHSKTSLTYGDYSFRDCEGLTELNLTDNVYIEGFNVIFRSCGNLSRIQVSETSPFYTTIDGVLYNKDITTIIFFPDGYTKEYELPMTIKKIAAGVFENKQNLKKITITKNVELIDTLAFKGCKNLKDLLFETGGTEDLIIGDGAFQYCYALTDVALPDRTKRIGSSAFAMDNYYNDSLKSITLNNGLEIIGANAFFRTGIKEITIPYTVQKIGSGAFIGSLLETITFEETPKTDANGNAITPVPLAFETAKINSKKVEVFVPNSTGMFLSCEGLKRIVLPERLEYIPSGTFQGCSAIEYVYIPSTVQNSTVYNSSGSSKSTKVRAIGDKAFYGCFNLNTVEFAKGGTAPLSFGNEVFAGCEALTTLNLPNRIASVNTALLDVFQRKTTSVSTLKYNVLSFGSSYDSDTKAYRTCGITTVNVEEGGAEYASYDGVLYTSGLKSVVFCPYEREGAVRVSYKAETFEKFAFGGCYKISEIIFDETPEGETPVDFELKSIKDPVGSYSNYENVFYGCISLKSIAFPSRLTAIGDYALARNTDTEKNNAIQSVTFADGCKIKSIGAGAFKNSGITSISLPEIWTSETERGKIGASLFEKCYNLDTLTLPKNLTASEFVSLSTNLPVLLDLIVPDGSENFVKDTDGVVYGLEKGVKTTIAYVPYVLSADTVVIPATVKTIADGAFGNRIGFKFLDFVNGTEPLTIGANAFKNSSLESVTLPSRLVEMGVSAFDGCENLKTLAFAEGYNCASIPNYAFRNTSIGGALEIPSSVSTIGFNAFEGAKITSVVFGRFSDKKNSVLTKISSYAFKNCGSLTSVKTLDYENSSDSSIAYISSSLPLTVSKNFASATGLFQGCAGLTSFTLLPEGITKIPNYFFDGCASLGNVVIPSSVTAIGDYAFRQCSNMTSVDFSKSKSMTIGASSFRESGVTEVNGFDKVTSTGSYAFADSMLGGSLEITTKNNVTKATYAFMGTKLTSVSIDTKDIQTSMFQNCSELVSVTLGSTVATIKLAAFNNCVKLEKVINNSTAITIIDGGTTEERGSFFGCAKLKIFASDAKTKEIEAGTAKPGIYIGIVKTSSSLSASIGGNAFGGCSLLEVLDLSESVETLSIGACAFSNCSGLKEIKFPAKIKQIGNEAFRNCSALTAVTIPSMTSTFGKLVFADCSNLSTLVYNGAKTLPEGAFANCGNLSSVTIGNTVTSIGKETFVNCGEITSIVLPENLTSIGASSFANCAKLTTVAFTSAKMPSIDGTSFTGCVNLTTLAANGATFENGALYTEDESGNLTLALYIGNAETFTVKDGTDTIGANAFKGNANIKAIDLKAVTTINNSAFEDCAALETVTAPKMNFIGEKAFKNCGKLNGVELTQVRTLKSYAFSGCTSLTSVQLVEIEEANLGSNVFEGCSSLATATVARMRYIGRYMFKNCTALESFSFDGVTYIATGAFSGSLNLASITNFDSVETLGYAAFEDCSSLVLENADFSKATLEGNSVFANCANIKSIKLGATVVPGYTFRGCTNLQSVEFVNGLTSIKNGGFDGCVNLDVDNMDLSKLEEMQYNAFSGCLQLTKIPSMPLLDELPSNAFRGCVNLTGAIDLRNYVWNSGTFAETGITEVTITAEQLEEYTLEEMTSLTKANVIGELTYIGSSAFEGCSSLSFDNIDFSKVVAVGGSAFKGCLGLTEVNMPSLLGITSAAGLFDGCTNITKVSMPLYLIDSVVAKNVSKHNDWFKDMTKLTEVNIPNMRNIADGMFDGCVNLEKVNAPDVRSVGANAFRNCAKLTSLSTEKLDGTVGDNAFEGCTLLENINLGKISQIGAAAFKGCTSIAKIELNQFVTKIGANAFEGWTEGQTVDVSKVSENNKPSGWDAEAFTGCGAKVLWLGANA